MKPLGQLTFMDGDVPGGAFHLVFENFPEAQAGGQYVLWLVSPLTETRAVAAFTALNHTVDITGSYKTNLPYLYNEAQITLEYLPESGDSAELPTVPSDRVIVSAKADDALVERMRPLIYLYDGVFHEDESVEYTNNAQSTGDDHLHAEEHEHNADGTIEGALSILQLQVDTALQHSGFLRNAISEADLEQAYRHTEHIVNILDGETGFVYSDLDRNGLTENPGDGFGVREYLTTIETLLGESTDLFAAQDKQALADELTAAVATSRVDIENVFDIAVKIISSDTAEEANAFAVELRTLIDELHERIEDLHSETLQMVPYTFYTPLNTASLPAKSATTGDTQSAVSTPAPLPLPVIDSRALAVPAPGMQWRNPLNGITYIYVPGGDFEMGASGRDAVSPKEEPRHRVAVESFWLQQTETTNAQYARCVVDRACTPPDNEVWDDSAFADYPVSNVTWEQANAYATWAGGRLPTEAEWERTCRADDGRLYPWGNEEATQELANFSNPGGGAEAVGSYPQGQSAYGALDLSGNLWEWTSSVEADYPYDAADGRETSDLTAGNRAVRGGSYFYTNFQLRCAARTGFTPDTKNEHVGFRVVLNEPTAVVRNPVDSAIYIYVPGGDFEMGASGRDAVSPKEEPRHRVTVESFWLQQTETTNAQYARCVVDRACTPPNNEVWDDSAFADYPVSNVTWEQANAYAAWAGGRLPTEAEWERTCRADDGRLYPWGNEDATQELANFSNPGGGAEAVGSHPQGQSAYGALDLSGNLWEWTSSVEADYPYDAADGREASDLAAGNRAVRGGSYFYTNFQLRCAARTGFAPDTNNEHVGFRVVLGGAGTFE